MANKNFFKNPVQQRLLAAQQQKGQAPQPQVKTAGPGCCGS